MSNKIIPIILVILVLSGAAAYLKFQQKPYEVSPSDLIKVTSPRANQLVQSPLTVKGEAKGFWYFEASFPIKILDENENVLGWGIAQAQSDWMTEEFVPFEAKVDFENTVQQKGFLVLKRDNPSGLPENDEEFRIPVILEKTQPQLTVDLYYYNSALDQDESGNIMCSRQGIVPVQRKIPITQTPIQDTIKLLLKGELTNLERAQGISTEYPLEGLSLEGASLNDGVLTLQFNDPNYKTGGGSCRVGILWFQIEKTAKQFTGVQSVLFLSEELFQP